MSGLGAPEKRKGRGSGPIMPQSFSMGREHNVMLSLVVFYYGVFYIPTICVFMVFTFLDKPKGIEFAFLITYLPCVNSCNWGKGDEFKLW